MVYHLNRLWKFQIVGMGIAACIFGIGGGAAFLAMGAFQDDIGSFLMFVLLFGSLGAELIFEGSRTKIELFDDRIVYHQSRYAFSAQWSDLNRIIPSPGQVVLRFSKSTKLQGGLAYTLVKLVGLHSSLAINYYVNDANGEYICERVAAGLGIEDARELQALRDMLGIHSPNTA